MTAADKEGIEEFAAHTGQCFEALLGEVERLTAEFGPLTVWASLLAMGGMLSQRLIARGGMSPSYCAEVLDSMREQALDGSPGPAETVQ